MELQSLQFHNWWIYHKKERKWWLIMDPEKNGKNVRTTNIYTIKKVLHLGSNSRCSCGNQRAYQLGHKRIKLHSICLWLIWLPHSALSCFFFLIFHGIFSFFMKTSYQCQIKAGLFDCVMFSWLQQVF